MSQSSLTHENSQEELRKVKITSKCICPPLEEPTKLKKKEKGFAYLDRKKRNGLDDLDDFETVPVPDIKTSTSEKNIEDYTIEEPESSANEISIQCDLSNSVEKPDIEFVKPPRVEMKEAGANVGCFNTPSSDQFDPCDASIYGSTASQNTNSDDSDLPCPPISRSPLQFGLRNNSGYSPVLPPTQPPTSPPTQPPTAQSLRVCGPTSYNTSECPTFLPHNSPPTPSSLPTRPSPNCIPPAYSSNFPPVCQSKYYPPPNPSGPSGSPSPSGPPIQPGQAVCSPRRPLTCDPNFTSTSGLCPPRARCVSPSPPRPNLLPWSANGRTPSPTRCPSPDRYSLPINTSSPCPAGRAPSPMRCYSQERYPLATKTSTPCPLPQGSSPTCPPISGSQGPLPYSPLVRSRTACQLPCPPRGRCMSPPNIHQNNPALRCSIPCPPPRSPTSYPTLGASKSASQPGSPKYVSPSSSQSPLLSAYSKSKCELSTSSSPDRRSFMKRLFLKKKA